MPRTVSKSSASLARARRAMRTWAGASLLLALSFAACDHATDGIDGPNLVDRFGDFSVIETLTASQATADFAGGDVIVFEATFNKQANWTLEIVGQESGAVKRIEGFSRELDDQNAVWNGGTTVPPFFRNETVDVSLTVDEENAGAPLTATIEVVTPRVYPGDVVTGFEADDEANIFLGNFEFDFDLMTTGISSEVPAAEGESFYLLRGTDQTLDNFFVGLLQITTPPGDEDGYFTVPTTIPEDLYFNSFIYNFGSDSVIPILEIAVDRNDNGVFDDGVDAIFATQADEANVIPFDEPGWSLYSRSVAELGLNQVDAGLIVAIRAVLISDNATQPNPRLPVDFGVDYITFTQGGPLEL